MLGKLLKFILRSFFGLIALIFLFGAITEGKEWLCFPVGFAIAGFFTAMTAKRKAVEGSAFKWGLYGALVPVISWIELVMATSQSKTKGFLKGIAYSFGGVFVFMAIFSCFLPSVPKEPVTQEIQAQTAAVIPVSEDKPIVVATIGKTEPKNDLAILPIKAVENPVPAVQIETKPNESTPIPSKLKAPEPKKVSGYLGEKRPLIFDDEDDKSISRPARDDYSGTRVVITPKGRKYHYASCRTVKGRYTTLTVAQARKRGYTPCKVCSPPSR